MMKTIDVKNAGGLDDYVSYAYLSAAVKQLREAARPVAARLRGRTLWMVNSTANGGGVAEMMPKMVTVLRDLGIVHGAGSRRGRLGGGGPLHAGEQAERSGGDDGTEQHDLG